MSEASLGFYHQTSNRLEAADYAIKCIRQFHPDSYYLLSCDSGPDYYDICKNNNVDLLHSQLKLGYPVGDFGYRKEKILELMKRMYIAFIKTNTTHMMYVEDDVLVKGKITLDPNWEVAAYSPICPFDNRFTQHIEHFSGVKPNVSGYGTCGGSIFKVSTYVDNYFKLVNWVNTYFDQIQYNIYQQIGWMDCFFTYSYLLCGKKYSVNPYFYNTWYPGDEHCFHLNDPTVEPQIIHGYKEKY
jgi:hypothetical protein